MWVRSLVRNTPWRRAWQPTAVFFPREFHGQWSLVGYSPGNHKESDMAEQLTLSSVGVYVNFVKLAFIFKWVFLMLI